MNRIKIKRYNFALSPETDKVLKQIKEETSIGFTKIIELSILDFAKKKGILK
jgi:hypothetical protein